MIFAKMRMLVLMFTVLLAGITVNGQTVKDYSKEWKSVEELVNKGLTKSAIDAVNKIYSQAKADNNDPQVIKALIFRIDLQQSFEEDATVNAIKDFEKEILLNKEPARSILYSVTAGLYWNYFQQNRYRFYQRTNTVNFKKDDIQTWTIDDFVNKTAELYLASISKDALLKNTKLETFDPVINKGNSRHLRPTLYDLLAHRALTFFENDERLITKPAYAFLLNDKEALAPASVFIRHRFTSKDTLSLHFKAIKIYQDLLAFHAKDANPEAFIDADLHRLEFVKDHGVVSNEDQFYRTALQQIIDTYSSSPASAQASFLIAELIHSSGKLVELVQENGKEPVDKNRFAWREAKQRLEAIIKKYPNSEGGINAKNLLAEIIEKEVRLTTEKVNLPGQPFRALINYRNVPSLNFRIIQLTPEIRKQIDENNRDDNQRWTKVTKLKSIRNWVQALPQTDDYRLHSTEIKIDELPVGQYALLGSVSPEFSLGNNPMVLHYFHISAISFVADGNEYFVLHRETGNPLAAAKVQVWINRYDYKTSQNIFEKAESYTTNNNGYIKIAEKKNQSRNIKLEITHGTDKVFLDDYQYSYVYENPDVKARQDVAKYERDKMQMFLFTDRSIYRPGQQVYFKAIMITTDAKTRKPKLVTGDEKYTAILYDANGQAADSVSMTLNDYGSMHNSFRLPEGRLNGQFSIRIKKFSKSFSVEEYKRPKFFVDFEKIKGTYRVNDNVTITGFAKAYAGNTIDGAQVKYRVTRVVRFLYPWMWWRWGIPRTQVMEITNGEITTGTDGKFAITFKAIPDPSVDKKFDPVFDYKIEADITDINGETRSGNVTVQVGYKALNLQVQLPSDQPMLTDSLKSLTVSTKNLNGEFEQTSINLKIFKLTPPARLIRERYWEQPDQFVMARNEYEHLFPNDEYKDETKKETWARSSAVVSLTEKTTEQATVKLDSKLAQGWYVAEVSAKDKYGQEVKDIKYFQVYDPKERTLPAPEYNWNVMLKNIVEPGESAKFITGTSAKDVHIIQQVDKNVSGEDSRDKIFSYSSLDNEIRFIDFPVTEEDRGGYAVNRFFVKDNRVYIIQWNVNVPWTNKQLDISFETFRDKTLPGSNEKWKIKISGKNGNKIAAEMLASMYDASLDLFRPHAWQSLNIWPTYNGSSNWEGRDNFTSVLSDQRYWYRPYIEPNQKVYDELAVNSYGGREMRSMGNMSMPAPTAARDMAKESMEGDAMAKKTSASRQANQSLEEVRVTLPPTPASPPPAEVQIRKNFNETAFFFPELLTDKDGNVEFSFTMPEALTKWKLMLIAHTKDLASGSTVREVITQKELMVQPNAPRFLREGDRMEFSTKLVNLTGKEITGEVELQLLNAATMQPVDGWFKNMFPNQYFTISPSQSTAVKFNIEIPYNYGEAVIYRIIARSGNLSDGEENSLPVLSNRMLVTETMPLPVRGNVTKTFTFEKLINSGKSESLSHHALTFEYTTNPSWLVVQALPFLAETKYECVDQIFNRFYANSLASKIANSSPRIKAIFEKWKNLDTAALLSNLQKNEELKAVLLQETPWVLEAKNEEQQKKNIALLFDMVRMNRELQTALAKLQTMQSSNGGFVWFKGSPDDRYMTQYIVTGLGHLYKLGAIPEAQQAGVQAILRTAIPYLDNKLKQEYDDLLKYKADLKLNNLSYTAIQYMYMRSFFKSIPVAQSATTAVNYYKGQAAKFWLPNSKYMQGMIALALYRDGNTTVANSIIASLKENAIVNEELGMYWRDFTIRGYFWHQAPIESQALMIEAFHEISKDMAVVDDLKTWLLKNKQTNNWQTAKATAEACYALLLQGTDWLIHERTVEIKAGDMIISSNNKKQEAGTGYFKEKLPASAVKSAMGNISITVAPGANSGTGQQPDKAGSSWGAVYWQYFEDLDKITFAETPLKLSKKLFKHTNSDRGPVLTPVNNNDELKPGDKIKVRIELRVDREMEYVHMKDMRASCMEPLNVISSYKYQDGLGYYESTKDASTNFFFQWLRKGTYVFEYSLFVTHAGNFSNGVTTIQSMYAPEFTAHSEGIRVNVADK